MPARDRGASPASVLSGWADDDVDRKLHARLGGGLRQWKLLRARRDVCEIRRPMPSGGIESATDLCEAQKANTSSTQGDERCDQFGSMVGQCIAMARSHDLFYGSPEVYKYGFGWGETGYDAGARAMEYCKSAGGKSCIVVSASVTCPNDRP